LEGTYHKGFLTIPSLNFCMWERKVEGGEGGEGRGERGEGGRGREREEEGEGRGRRKGGTESNFLEI
jgi:hypothetical protein